MTSNYCIGCVWHGWIDSVGCYSGRGMAQRFVDVNVDSLTDKDLLWADMAFIGGMAVQRKSAKKIIARCNASNLKVVAGEPLYTSFTKEFAIHRKRWALKRSPGENDGGNCEESLRIEYFMQ